MTLDVSIRVAIADDHQIFRAGLKQLLEASPDLRVVAEYETGRAVVQAAGKDLWDVLILDLTLPLLNGAEVLTRLRELETAPRVLVLSMYSEEHYGARMRRAGAAGFLSKTAPSEMVIDAIRKIHRGERPPVESPSTPELTLPHELLSAREHQVFMLLAQGRAVNDIAAELNVSASTVSTHIAHIREKLGVSNLAEIIRYAFTAGLID